MAQDYKIRHATLTLDGSAQRLLAGWGVVGAGNPVGGVNDIAAEAIYIQPDGANANPIYLGGDAVSAADHGFSLPAGAAGVPPSPFKLDAYTSRVKPSQLYVIGTAAQKVHITIIGY